MAVNQKSGSGIAGDTLYSSLNITDGDKAILSKFGSCSFIYTLSEEASDAMVEILQDFFKIYPLGQAFNQDLRKMNKEVTIVPAYADNTMNVPQITIESVPVDALPVSLGNRIGLETFDGHLFNRYSGLAKIATTLSIRDTSKRMVSRLADVTFLAMGQFVPFHMGARHINVEPQIKFTNPIKETGSKLGGEVFLAKQAVTLETEWNQYLEILAPTIADIKFVPARDT